MATGARQPIPAAAPAAPRPGAARQVLRRRPVTPSASYVPLPAPRGPAPYRRALADVLGPGWSAAIAEAGPLRFHCLGDTGGWREGRPQHEVAAALTRELAGPEPAHFLYHLGDLVYPHGELAHYRAQFHAPYARYSAPIFAIPGNHDGEAPAGPDGGSLEPFLRTFCTSTPPLRDAGELTRPPAGQPHVHWTLTHERLWIVGLYTNVHEDGEVAAEQLRWLTDELRAAPDEVTLIVAMHRPVYSVDVVHGSNLDLGDALDACFAAAGRLPDAVLAAHAHDYQRFARRIGGRVIPYVVAGNGGFHERHAAGAALGGLPASFPGLDGVTLEALDDAAHGFLTVSVTDAGAELVYRAVIAGEPRERDRCAIVRGA